MRPLSVQFPSHAGSLVPPRRITTLAGIFSPRTCAAPRLGQAAATLARPTACRHTHLPARQTGIAAQFLPKALAGDQLGHVDKPDQPSAGIPGVASYPWCEPERLLAGIFSFKHLPASQLQSPAHIQEMVRILRRFLADIGDHQATKGGAPRGLQWAGLAESDLASLRAAAAVLSSDRVTWYSKFGCALLALGQQDGDQDGGAGGFAGSIRPRPDDLSLLLIGLDEWKFKVHSSPGRDQHTASCDCHTIMCCGSVAADKYDRLLAAVELLASRRGKEGQNANRKGPQHTPAFLHAAVSRALAALSGTEAAVDADGLDAVLQAEGIEAKVQARGGFTDVGQHTGNDVVRDTCWPLVMAVMQVVLARGGVCPDAHQQPSLLLRQALAHLELWLLRRQVQLIRPATATPDALTAAMQMLQSAATRAAELADEGHDMTTFEADCRGAELYLRSVAAQRAVQTAQGLELPVEGSPDLVGDPAFPTGVLPPPLLPSALDVGLDAAKRRADRNLGSLPLLPPNGASFKTLLALMKHPQWQQQANDVTALLVLRSVETELFRRAAWGFTAPVNQLDLVQVNALEEMVDLYRLGLQRFMNQPDCQALLRKELLSREVLVVWVAYCMMHEAACREYPIVLRYGVLGPYLDLGHLVLSDKAAVDAALSVCAYLQSRNVPGRQLFSLHDQGAATMAMALEFARGCPHLQGIWAAEQADAAARAGNHWAEVTRKKKEAADLRRQLQRLEEEGSSLAEQWSRHRQNEHVWQWAQWASHDEDLSRRIRRNSDEAYSTRAALEKAETAPPAVIQPLPKDNSKALMWLFFLHMPPLFRRLSRASFLAQQMLVPTPGSFEGVSQAIAVNDMKTSLVQHYNVQRRSSIYLAQPSTTVDGADGAVMLMSPGSVPNPKEVGPRHIDLFHSSSDGVWHPDSLTPRMAWAGSGSQADQALCSQGFPSLFNPFARVQDDLREQYFTEQLPEGASSLQWTMQQRGTAAATPAERGNMGIAVQDSRPDWLSKPGFLEFTSLRSYPLRQLRRLCVALHERNLPLEQPAVQVLVRQLLYQIGTITSGSPPALLWRTGWEREGDVLPTLCCELESLAEELNNTVGKQEAVLLLGEVAAYLADWYPPCGAVARRFADMTSRAADEMDTQLMAAADDGGLVAALLAKQSRWRVMALLCYGAGPISMEDAAAMVQLMVLINHGRVFQEDPKLLAEMERLQVRAHNVMASRIIPLMEAASSRPAILTAAVARVLQQRTPDTLPWRQLEEAAAVDGWKYGSFEAFGADSRLYSINLLDGTVLFDGWPPNRLPKGVTEHPLYRRTFGSYNFEVAFTGAGKLQTLRPIHGRLYDFHVSPDGQRLSVTEVDKGHGVELELLDAGQDMVCGEWGGSLPARLRELHSHWLCRVRNVILLRPTHFQEQDVHFLVAVGWTLSATPSPSVWAQPCEYDCRRVPPHLRALHWTQLLSSRRSELTDRLVLLRGSRVVDIILAKFEDTRYIHTYFADAPNGVSKLIFELPRFGLEFETDDGQLLSSDYSGYRLQRCQLLVQQREQDGGGPGVSYLQPPGTVLYTLPEFRQYLVLEQDPGSGLVVGSRRADVLVVVPAGEVVGTQLEEGGGAGGKGMVRVSLPSWSGQELKAHCYEVHGRFGHLRASSVLARLQLAALYAATSTLLPEPLSRCTGAQMAMELLRQCWGNRPLTSEEAAQLHSVGRLGGHLAAGLRLLVHELEASAAQLRVLHAAPVPAPAQGRVAGEGEVKGHPMPALDLDAGHRYLHEASPSSGAGGWGPNPRLLLTLAEEMRVLGCSHSAPEQPAWRWQRRYKPIGATEPFPVRAAFVEEAEDALACLVMGCYVGGAASKGSVLSPPYPLVDLTSEVAGLSPLEVDMHEELTESWDAHFTSGGTQPQQVQPDTLETVRRMQAQVRQLRAAAEEHLQQHLSAVPVDVGCHGASFRLRRLCGAAPSAGPLDLLRAAWQPQGLLAFNPFLAPEAVAELRSGVLVWLQLCVLEDRLGRLEQLAAAWKAGEDCLPQLVQELQVRRTWDVSQHPQWLVFEAEGQLQIRPAQYTVARHLKEHPGAIAQLNMGEGKTRVILPMLALHWADGNRVVRLNLLSTLLDEAYGHMHNNLCAGVLGRKIFTLPFHRGVKLTAADARAMGACLRHCMREGGLLMVAPEHRMSLQLKSLELWAAGKEAIEVYGGVNSILQLPYLDMLDESDELLHHRFQLVYACGAPMALPALHQRAGAVQALMRIASRLAATKDSPPLLPKDAAVMEPPTAASSGAFSGVRLLPGPALEAAVPRLHRQLVEELLGDPPYELSWLKGHPLKDRILLCVTDETRSAEEHLGVPHSLTDDQLDMVLALRGLLACNVLRHCLQKRHRVEYGVSRPSSHQPAALGTRRTRMAVPFRAAHTPSERSEFAQPDVALVLTCLSYYHDGLSYEEFLAAVRKLLSMGLSAQRALYAEWLALSKDRIPEADLADLPDQVGWVDPTNPQQMATMHRHLRHNMAVVDFWLNLCVLPSEARQFPQRLAASAWHLADNARGEVVGFSGTNDNHRLLPLAVHQAQLSDSALRATNGKMLAVLRDHTLGFSTLQHQEARQPVWRGLLEVAVARQVDAILDCGALLAGASNREAAAYLLPRLDGSRFQGVCYFDEALRCWAICDTRGRRMPRHSSPIAERATFVIYDEARCRGADLQLRRDAVGLLTLGPGACKDKVMQAAGRLRQLGRGQKLHFIATADVAAKISQLNSEMGMEMQPGAGAPGEAPALPVLRWVMHNTVQATQAGLLAWATQGLHFAASKGAPGRAMQPEALQLDSFYGGSKAPVPVGDVVEGYTQQRLQNCEASGGLAPDMRRLMQQISGLSWEYGSGYYVTTGAGAGDEECERELEEDEEEEEEVERQVPRVTSDKERDWNYVTALNARSASQVHDAAAALLSLPQFIKSNLQPPTLGELGWSPRAFCTANFRRTVTNMPAGAALNEYLRPVDAVLLLPSGELVLLSEREADQLQALAWARTTTFSNATSGTSAAGEPLLLSLCYARQAFVTDEPPKLVVDLAAGVGSRSTSVVCSLSGRLGAGELVSAQLFNGEVEYGSEAQRDALRALVARRLVAVEEMVAMRGKQSLLPRSDLERAARDWGGGGEAAA